MIIFWTLTLDLEISLIYQVSQKNVPLAEVLPSSKGTFFLGHPVHSRELPANIPKSLTLASKVRFEISFSTLKLLDYFPDKLNPQFITFW